MAKILVAEDEPLVRLLIVDTLQEADHTVLEAIDGLDALAIVEKNPDLAMLVTDIRMPKLDGFKLAEAVRRIRPELKLLFMTGYAARDLSASFENAWTIEKPFDPDEIVGVVEKILRA
jgi:CheY-like chemotaxis protein